MACRSSVGLTGRSAVAVACWQGSSVVPIGVLGVAVPLSDFPRYPLMFGPSPVHRLERLSAHLGGVSIWAKREDCNAGLAFGGNKVRKLEYLVPEALAQGVVRNGAIGKDSTVLYAHLGGQPALSAYGALSW
jgi:1-aminocyclopropane-1-carboxylate deaminase/D-cysteine desulfhydrase-like pyridoxal-dependent ACC family enzyme